MIIVPIVAVAGVIAGYIARGSLRNFERVHVYWWGAALAGVTLQILPLHRWLDGEQVDVGGGVNVALATLLASYALLLAFVWVNRRLPAAPLLLLGLVLNVLVIGVNEGMPVSEAALRTAQAPTGTLPSGIDDEKHHLMTSSDVLTPLADVIGLPPPISTVLSIGDIFLYAGIVVFTVIVMRGRFEANRRPPAWIPMYRGKHLSPERRLPRRSRPGAGPQLAAVSSGTSR